MSLTAQNLRSTSAASLSCSTDTLSAATTTTSLSMAETAVVGDPPPSSSPPQKVSLKAFWLRLRARKKESELLYPNPSSTNSDSPSLDTSTRIDEFADENIFGQPLASAVEKSSASIDRVLKNGRVLTYGPLPTIISVCGQYLQQNVQGIFRINGSVKRIRELQRLFAEPPSFGQDMDWTGYTVHDAASVIRRYLNSLPEPIIPLDLYDMFRAPFINRDASKLKSDDEAALLLTLYSLMKQLPPANRRLLLYLLDLLELFAKNSKKNLMPSANLAAMFQPCILSHPLHDVSPEEYEISQSTVLFLVEHVKQFRNMTELDSERGVPRLTLWNTVRRTISSGSTWKEAVEDPGMRKTLRRSATMPIKRSLSSTILPAADLDHARRAADAAPLSVALYLSNARTPVRSAQSNRSSLIDDSKAREAVAGAAAALTRSRSVRTREDDSSSIQNTPELIQQPFDEITIPKRAARKPYSYQSPQDRGSSSPHALTQSQVHMHTMQQEQIYSQEQRMLHQRETQDHQRAEKDDRREDHGRRQGERGRQERNQPDARGRTYLHTPRVDSRSRSVPRASNPSSRNSSRHVSNPSSRQVSPHMLVLDPHGATPGSRSHSHSRDHREPQVLLRPPRLAHQRQTSAPAPPITTLRRSVTSAGQHDRSASSSATANRLLPPLAAEGKSSMESSRSSDRAVRPAKLQRKVARPVSQVLPQSVPKVQSPSRFSVDGSSPLYAYDANAVREEGRKGMRRTLRAEDRPRNKLFWLGRF